MSAAKLWWCSWREYESPVDTRPIHSPPNAAIIGWWETGGAGDGSYSTMCALVHADDEKGVAAAIKKEWPAAERRWRIEPHRANNIEGDVITFSDRFPFGKTELARLKKLGLTLKVNS